MPTLIFYITHPLWLYLRFRSIGLVAFFSFTWGYVCKSVKKSSFCTIVYHQLPFAVVDWHCLVFCICTMVTEFLWFSAADFLLSIIMNNGNCASSAFFSLLHYSYFFVRQRELPHTDCSSFSLAILNLCFP